MITLLQLLAVALNLGLAIWIFAVAIPEARRELRRAEKRTAEMKRHLEAMRRRTS